MPLKKKSLFRLTTFLYQCPLVAQRLVMLLACGWLSLGIPAHSLAGGLYITEFGTPSTEVANAGAVAVGKDASTAWHNPASMTRISGQELMAAAGVLIPSVKFDPDSDTPVQGGDEGQAGLWAPVLGTNYVHSLTDKLNFGFALGSLAGAGLDYGKTWAGRNMSTEVNLLM